MYTCTHNYYVSSPPGPFPFPKLTALKHYIGMDRGDDARATIIYYSYDKHIYTYILVQEVESKYMTRLV